MTPDSGAGQPIGEVVAVLRLLEASSFHLLEPVGRAPGVEHLWIVRPGPPGTRQVANSTYHEIRGGAAARVLATYRAAVRLARRPRVSWLVSFNPVPYGLIALAAARRTGKRAHLGFVGTDWYRHCRSAYGPLLNRWLRTADLFSASGRHLVREMVARGYPERRIFQTFPHSIDIEAFEPRPTGERTVDLLFVGRLAQVKRVDLVLDAIALVREHHPDLRAAIVGDGPLRAELERRSGELDLSGNVTFAGYQGHPEPWFSDARILVSASDREGGPFTVVEALAAGAVPVATDVGTARQMLGENERGLIVPPGQAAPLAVAIRRLLEDPVLYEGLRERGTAYRSRLSHDIAAVKWAHRLSDPEDPSGD